MSTTNEGWTPAVGDRVRVVMDDIRDTAEGAGQVGKIVQVRQVGSETMCDVEYDGDAVAAVGFHRTHKQSELVPIEGDE